MQNDNLEKKGSGDRNGQRRVLLQDSSCEVLFLGLEKGKRRYEITLSKPRQWEIMEALAGIIKYVPNKEIKKLEGLQSIAEILLTAWKYVKA